MGLEGAISGWSTLRSFGLEAGSFLSHAYGPAGNSQLFYLFLGLCVLLIACACFALGCLCGRGAALLATNPGPALRLLERPLDQAGIQLQVVRRPQGYQGVRRD